MVEVASSAETTYNYIPKGYTIPEDADYFHVTSNNTIYGTEIRKDLDCPIPMIADMSSDIFSRPVDVSKYICIYGGAQKNLAPAGATFVIVKDEALNKARVDKGTLMASGFIAGGALMGVVSAALKFAGVDWMNAAWAESLGGSWCAVAVYTLLILFLIRSSMSAKKE